MLTPWLTHDVCTFLQKNKARILIFITQNPIVTKYDACFMPMALKYEIAFHFHLNSCIWKNKWESGYNYLCLNVNYPIVLKWLCYHLWNRISLSSHDLICSFAALVSFFKFIWIAEFCFIKHQKNNQCEFVRFLVKGHWTIFWNFLFCFILFVM